MWQTPLLMFYLGRQFLQWLLIVMTVLISVILLFDYIEITRRFASREHVDAFLLFVMAVYKLPNIFQQALPFAILFSAMIMLHRAAMRHEIIAARAAGFSIWQMLTPFIIMVFLISIIDITLVNPLSSLLRGEYEKQENKLLNNNQSNVIVNQSGVWLRHANDRFDLVIHAKNISNYDYMLEKPVFYRLKKNLSFVDRVDADYATLENGYWSANNARISLPGGKVTWKNQVEIPTDLTIKHVQSSLSGPSTISIWQLPEFIQNLKDTGIDAKKYEIRFYHILVSPLLNIAMVVFACVFVARNLRRRSSFKSFFYGIILTFGLYFVTRFTQALGVTGVLPMMMAVFVPTAFVLFASLWAILHYEETA